MNKNVGSIDRMLRIAVGLGIIAAGVYFKSWWGAVGIVPLFTALVNWCPAYLPLGINTCRTGSKQGA